MASHISIYKRTETYESLALESRSSPDCCTFQSVLISLFSRLIVAATLLTCNISSYLHTSDVYLPWAVNCITEMKELEVEIHVQANRIMQLRQHDLLEKMRIEQAGQVQRVDELVATRVQTTEDKMMEEMRQLRQAIDGRRGEQTIVQAGESVEVAGERLENRV